MSKNKNSETVAAVANGLATAWKSYKRTAARRHSDPMTSFINDIFGIEMNDVDAASYLAQDVCDIVDNVRDRKNDRKFRNIVKNSF